MCSPAVAGAAMQAQGAITNAFAARNEAIGEKNQLNYEGDVANNNATLAGEQASQALRSGQFQEQNVRLQGAQTNANLESQLAGSGVVTTSGSAQALRTGAAMVSEQDALAVRDNALRTAWGFNQEAENYRTSARNDWMGASTLNPNRMAFATLLNQGGSVAPSWFKLGQAGGFSGGGGSVTADSGLGDMGSALNPGVTMSFAGA